MLQAHMDMVCEKAPEAEHDFMKDPIHWELDGDILSTADDHPGCRRWHRRGHGHGGAGRRHPEPPRTGVLFTRRRRMIFPVLSTLT